MEKKTFANFHRNAKFAKVFSRERNSLYGIISLLYIHASDITVLLELTVHVYTSWYSTNKCLDCVFKLTLYVFKHVNMSIIMERSFHNIILLCYNKLFCEVSTRENSTHTDYQLLYVYRIVGNFRQGKMFGKNSPLGLGGENVTVEILRELNLLL